MRPQDWRIVVQAWLGTRLLFALLAVGLAVAGRRDLGSVIIQWDVVHFLTVAREGYADPQEMAFFPGLPLFLRGASLVGVPPVVAGVLLALACSLAAALALARLGGPWAAVAWLLAPTGVFTAVPYTESPFCAAAFWAWERATGRHWGQAAALAAVACTLRVSGLFLIGALAVLAVTQRRRREPLWTPLAWLALPSAVLVGFAVYLHSLTGSWTAWFSAQASGWQRGFHWPWQAFANSWASLFTVNLEHPEWVWIFRGEMISWLLGLTLTVVLLVRRRIAEASWVGVQVLAFSLSFWFMSVNRAVMLWFPLWTMIGEAVEGRRGRGWQVLAAVVAVIALAVQGIWAYLYFTGRWAS